VIAGAAPLNPQARKRIELAAIRFELTEAGRAALAESMTASQLAQDALCRALPGEGAAARVLDAHLRALAAQGLRPRPSAVHGARTALRRLLKERQKEAARVRRARSTHPTTPEACR
jgi:hypothetical protein